MAKESYGVATTKIIKVAEYSTSQEKTSVFRNATDKLRAKISFVFRDRKVAPPVELPMWPPGEIKLGQEESYAGWLKGVINNRDIVNSQLIECCVHNLTRKFKILCDAMAESPSGIDLHIPDVQSCLLAAAANNSIDVCEVILSVATREQLMVTIDSSPDYEGSTALHVMVVNELTELVPKYLDSLERVDRLIMLNTHMSGKHFVQKMNVSSLPLHLACWTGNPEIFDLLMSYGAELDARDIKGNTILHVLVELGKEYPELAKKMIETVVRSDASRRWYCLKNGQDPTNWTAQDDVDLRKHMFYIENDDGYTPLTWAARHRNRDMLEFLLNIEGVHRRTLWRFGRSSYVLYDMKEIDPIIAKLERPGKPSVLELLAYDLVNEEVVKCFSIPAIEQCVKYKWRNHLYNFFAWAVMHIALLVVCYQISVRIREGLKKPHSMFANMTETLAVNVSAMDLVKDSRTLQAMLSFVGLSLIYIMILEMIAWANSLIMFIMVISRRWHGKLYNAPVTVIFKNDIYRVVCDTFAVCQLLAIFYLVWHSSSSSYMAFAFICGCYFLMYFLQGFQTTSYFGTLMHLVISTDMINFAYVFSIMLVGFGGTMMMVVYDPHDIVPGFESLQAATLSMFELMAGLGVLDNTAVVKNKQIVTGIFVLFICVTVILLLNMLIAAMSESYAKLAQYRQEIWLRNRASVMLRFETFSLIVYCKIRTGRYLQYDSNYCQYNLYVETSSPATCV